MNAIHSETELEEEKKNLLNFIEQYFEKEYLEEICKIYEDILSPKYEYEIKTNCIGAFYA